MEAVPDWEIFSVILIPVIGKGENK